MNRIITLKSISSSIIFTGCLLLLNGCSLQKVSETPAPGQYTQINGHVYNNGFPEQKQPWVVYSDRSGNRITPIAKENPDVVYKEASFLAPFIVLTTEDKMFKVVAYKPDLVNDGKLPKTKQLNVAGWIPEERLLLWSNSLKNSETGFAPKAAIVVNHPDVIMHAEKYIENDSALLFTGPDLTNKAAGKISLGSIVYMYKQSEDKQRVLIGKLQSVTPDSIQNNIYGWISKNMVSVWGERASLKVASDYSLAIVGLDSVNKNSMKKPYVSSPEDLRQRTGMASIYPVNSLDGLSDRISFFTNIFDYNGNKIYNVLGNPVYYTRYREILSNNRKLNVIFVLDMSKNNQPYIPLAQSLLQELQLNFVNPAYFSSVKFGGVVYKQNSCGVSPLYSSLSSNYRDIALFFDDKTKRLFCNDADIAQPVDKGLSAAAKILAGHEDETNLIILIGTTANQNQSQAAINAATQANARLIFFQTQSKSADAYNDFVLLAEKTVVNSAKNIVQRKKEKIVNQTDLLVDSKADNNYSFATGENGIYYLDYPKQSMTQGFVIFPRKGETMQIGMLKSAIDTLLLQVTSDNKRIDSTLTRYFRSEIGVNNTKLAPIYSGLFPSFAGNLIPVFAASSLFNQRTSFLVDGMFAGKQDSLLKMMKHGILLNELEYERLRNFYADVYKRELSINGSSKKERLRAYLKVVSEYTPALKNAAEIDLEAMPMRELVKRTTGFLLKGNTLMDRTPEEWIKNDKITPASVLKYFEQFREIAAKLGVSKGDNAIRVEYKGQVFYWLDEEYIPMLK